MRDRDLLRRYLAGDQDAFATLVERHSQWVYVTCQRRLRNASEAEDAAQVVFLALAKAAAKVARLDVIEGWLHKVSRYTAMRMQRDNTRRTRREREAAEFAPSKETRERWQAMEGRLEEAMDRLGKTDREVILLRFYRQLSHAEAGEALGISEEAAKKRASRAVEKLRMNMAGVMGDAEGIGAALLAYGAAGTPAGLQRGLELIGRAGANTKIVALTQGVMDMMKRAKLAMMGWVTASVLAVALVTVPLVNAETKTQSAPNIAATAPADDVAAAQRRELAAVQEVLRRIDDQMQIVALTSEYLTMRQTWVRKEARLELRLAQGQAARLVVAEKLLNDTRIFHDRIQQRAMVDADLVTTSSAKAYLAEAEVVVERVKSGEAGDAGL